MPAKTCSTRGYSSSATPVGRSRRITQLPATRPERQPGGSEEPDPSTRQPDGKRSAPPASLRDNRKAEADQPHCARASLRAPRAGNTGPPQPSGACPCRARADGSDRRPPDPPAIACCLRQEPTQLGSPGAFPASPKQPRAPRPPTPPGPADAQTVNAPTRLFGPRFHSFRDHAKTVSQRRLRWTPAPSRCRGGSGAPSALLRCGAGRGRCSLSVCPLIPSADRSMGTGAVSVGSGSDQVTPDLFHPAAAASRPRTVAGGQGDEVGGHRGGRIRLRAGE